MMVHLITKRILLIIFIFGIEISQSQDLMFTKTGKVSFFSKTPLEDINALNQNVTAFLNLKNGEIFSTMKMVAFIFPKSLMQEHFNENYMESDKYPDGTIKGSIENFSNLDFTKDFETNVNVIADITMHGVTKKRTIPIKLKSVNKVIYVEGNFDIILQDHQIERPKILWQKIAEKIDVKVYYQLYPYKK